MKKPQVDFEYVSELLEMFFKRRSLQSAFKETLKKTSISGEIHASHELNG